MSIQSHHYAILHYFRYVIVAEEVGRFVDEMQNSYALRFVNLAAYCFPALQQAWIHES